MLRVKRDFKFTTISVQIYPKKCLKINEWEEIKVYFADDSSGRKYSKDPAVVYFNGRYLMYYSAPPMDDSLEGWSIGIAESDDLDNWRVISHLSPSQEIEKKGFCAPGAIVINERVHLFYQSYGNFPLDKICHAYSDDGINFTRNPKNPIFSPTGDWNSGRAIDADVVAKDGELYMYWATRDKDNKIQKIGVSKADINSSFYPDDWKQCCNDSILEPELIWEDRCIEAPAVCVYNEKFYMFYAGAYNNFPQQIGCAVSDDGINYTRIFTEPFLRNGKQGTWNSSESGHPYVFEAPDGKWYLFYQGNNDNGKTWYLSKKEFVFQDGIPKLI